VLWRNDSRVREMEGTERTSPTPQAGSGNGDVEEDGLRFQVAPRTGRKTGWFYDQRDNRTGWIAMSGSAGVGRIQLRRRLGGTGSGARRSRGAVRGFLRCGAGTGDVNAALNDVGERYEPNRATPSRY